ncbi:nucleotidyltransferase family protein [Sphingobacterium sp.]|uniref:nucleotidyltransferase family protein n=1 Tax=Sphingobacterium sp. TaxID=341027 RepID=UPI0028B206D2|nr:nucleotidyltransferase family protein [Sphingobacterium sp.]
MKGGMPQIGPRVRLAFLEALRSSLWNRPAIPSSFEGLDRQDWREIFTLSFQQTVEGHIADAIATLPADLLPPHELVLKWAVRLQRMEERDIQMKKVIAYQGWMFRENGIRSVLQKGHGVSLYYEKPEIRHMGDIDWFFPEREGFIRANGLVSSTCPSFSLHTRYSSGYTFQGIEIEHHRKLVQLRNPLISRYAEGLVGELQKENLWVDIAGESIEIPSPMLNIIQVNAHILKHQVTYGIGLRQLCDSARLYHRFSGHYDGNELRLIYGRLGILRWAHAFHRVLVELLGLKLEDLPFGIEGDQDVEWMKEYILRTGNFGFYDPDNPDIERPGGRINRSNRLLENFRRFYPLAPAESACFPVVHLYNKVFR